ncbi:hypothetical protein METBIDRAFT_12210 [Metschnikowia bicuspidata var. bicuspidata NRRL YB-4993]|uniref:Uncharacterized protein n=1 Tax=Metschnikowia bicuspidata var. bicuspidata NRRL YB-4993 TaxID=869754 RepID=A0A1A0HCL4_9ASCO|nr:hypothetical protein METBIDRAFT_12210 [Metschnikowia bicuspidata var. bicuspidata NRRL YB-4993]OBA21735.1 hypothetical protein METBIDRAFT_12210 [Metschnikowia bicuspidata var. bicuspidata NRRL YB-4993]
MAIDCSSANNLRNTLDNLSISSSPEPVQDCESSSMHPQTTRSLLSKSLAGECHRESAAPDPQQFRIGEDDVYSSYGHPEPSLLATSIGKDHDGRLIPSSSTISLLSLNSNVNGGSLLTHPETFNTSVKGSVPGLTHANPDRVSSYTNLRSRNSITHLGQQRLQPYHKLSSPIAPSLGEFSIISSPKTIPWGKNQMTTPDSPNLNPTSFGESPSRFWLSAQTPPKSLTMPKHKNQFVGPLGFAVTPFQQKNQQKHAFTNTINITRGGDSPVLIPVQTPIEDIPMTPLYLNSEGSYFADSNGPRDYGEARADYFSGANESLLEEKEQALSDSEDHNMD